MRLSALGDVAKIVAFVVGSFLLAALISPPLYEMGKGFAEVALKKDTTDELTWLAGKAKRNESEVIANQGRKARRKIPSSMPRKMTSSITEAKKAGLAKNMVIALK
ncbi:hypothetical protein N9275_00645, partial [bacterium]|nr:hypothetical protein [bacterium]